MSPKEQGRPTRSCEPARDGIAARLGAPLTAQGQPKNDRPLGAACTAIYRHSRACRPHKTVVWAFVLASSASVGVSYVSSSRCCQHTLRVELRAVNRGALALLAGHRQARLLAGAVLCTITVGLGIFFYGSVRPVVYWQQSLRAPR